MHELSARELDVDSEALPEYITNENIDQFRKLRNDIQRVIITSYVKEKLRKFEGEYMDSATLDDRQREFQMEWATNFSKKFSEAFSRMIVSNPHLLQDLQAIPEAEISLIEDELYDRSE